MKDPKAIRKAIMTAKSIASLIDPKFARVPLPDIGLPAPDFVVPDHSPSIHEAYDMPMPQKYAAGGDVDDNEQEIIAYHGSANEFPEFSMGARGRGQGQRAFGEGHNFAEDEDVARRYRNMTARQHGQADVIHRGTGEALPFDAPEAQLFRDAAKHGERDIPHAAQHSWPQMVKALTDRIDEFERVRDEINDDAWVDSEIADMRGKVEAYKRAIDISKTHRLDPKGHMYEVALRLNPDKLLKWHEPLEEQPESVRRHLIERGIEHSPEDKGSDIYRKLSGHPDNEEGYSPNNKYSADIANKTLSDLGVHGIKWKDTDSAIAPGRGAHNYTVWDDSRIKVRRKYALGGDVDAGRELNKFGLYSHAAEQAAALPQERGTPEQYRGMLLNRGVKPAELEWSGFDDAFANKPQVTRDELAEHFRTNMPDLYETQYGGSEQGGESYNQMRDRHAQENRELFLNIGLAQAHGTPYEGETSTQMINRHAEERANLKDQAYHEDYTVPGGENYREVLIQHNAFGGFEGVQGHFGGAPDIIASLRLKDREDTDGNKLLHLEELQSDWAQQGRKKGFADDAAAKLQAAREEYEDFMHNLAKINAQGRIDAWKMSHPGEEFPEDKMGMLMDIARDSVERHPISNARSAGLEDVFHRLSTSFQDARDNSQYRKLPAKAAYVGKTDDWVDLGLKRALLEAAKGDYDKLAWSPGDVHADRYDLSRHISKIRHEKNEDGTYNLDVFDKNGTRVFDQDDMHPDTLEETVGKEMAEKIIAGHGDKDEDPGYRDWRTISGLDLRVGGEGMRKFYDDMLPKRLTKLIKQHDPDAKLTRSVIEHDDPNGYAGFGSTEIPAIEITPRMRESILKKGFAAYADGGEVEGYAIGGVPDIDVEQYRKHLKRIYSPLSEDPEAVKKALQISSSYRSPVGMETGTGSLYNIKQSIPAIDVNPTIEDIPGISMKKPVKKSWEDFYQKGKGGVFINMGGDLSNFGRLTHINGKKLAWPVDLHAGTKFMLEPNPKYVWGNAAGHSTAFENKIRSAEETGKDVYGIFSPMGPSAVNSSHNMFDALMAQIPDAGIDKKHMREFDAAIKRGDHLDASIKSNPKKLKAHLNALKAWPGLENAKEASEFARPEAGNLTGTHRTMIVKFMDKADWLKKGFPEVGVTRSAITDPELKGVGGNKIGHRVVKLSSEDLPGAKRAFEHSTYPTYTSGEYVMDVPLVQRHYAAPDVIEQMVMKPTKAGQVVHPYSEDPLGRATARKLFEEQKQMQPINPRFLDSVMMGMENQEKYGFKKGGTVRRALMIAKSAKKK